MCLTYIFRFREQNKECDMSISDKVWSAVFTKLASLMFCGMLNKAHAADAGLIHIFCSSGQEQMYYLWKYDLVIPYSHHSRQISAQMHQMNEKSLYTGYIGTVTGALTTGNITYP